MAIKISNFFNYQNNNSKIGDFQDLEHIDGVSISATTANLYEDQSYTDLVTCNDENSNVAPKATIKSKKGPFKKIEKPMDNGDENS